jgi:hypothetical protein
MESITTIEWDWLDNSFIADDGTCYKTIEDIPEDLQHLVQPIPEVKKQKYRVRVSKRSTSCPYPWVFSFD